MSFVLSVGSSTPSSGANNENHSDNSSKSSREKSKQISSLPQAEKEINRLHNANKALKKKIAQLQRELKNKDDNGEEEEENMAQKYEKLEEQYKLLKQSEHEKESKVTKLEFDIQDAELENNELKNEAEKLKVEINRLNSIIDANKGEQLEKQDEVDEALKVVESLIEVEANDLKSVSSQRAEFVKFINQYDQTAAKYDDLLQDAYNQIDELKLTVKLLQGKLDEESGKNAKTNDDILNQIIKLNPVEYQQKLEEMKNLKNSEKIVELFKYERENGNGNNNKESSCCKNENSQEKNKQQANNSNNKKDKGASNAKKQNKPDNANNDKKEVKSNAPLTQREKTILAHLDNAIHYIKMMAESAGSPLHDDQNQECLQQIAQIRKFIDSQGQIEDISSIFEFDDPEAQIQTVNEFIEKNETNLTPFSELYTLFKGVLNVNKLLFANYEHLSSDSKADKKKLQRMKAQNQDIDQKYDALRQRVNEATDKLRECVDEPSGDFFIMIEKLIATHMGMVVENADQWQTIDNLNKAVAQERDRKALGIDHLSSTGSNNHNHELSNTDSLNDSKAHKRDAKQRKIIDAYRKKCNKLTVELQNVYKQLNDANATIEHLKVELMKSEQINQLAQQNAHAELQNALEKNEDLTAQITELKEKHSQGDSYSSIFNTKEKAMSSEILTLKNRIAELERQNNEILNELKNRNASLSKKYEAQLRTLNKDLSDARKMLTDAQNDIAALEKNKNALQLQIAKLKLSDRSKDLKLSQMTEYFNTKAETDKSNTEVKLLAQKAQFEKTIKKINDEVQHCTNLLKDTLEESFGTKPQGDGKLTEVTESLINALNDLNVKEARATKEKVSKIQTIYGNPKEKNSNGKESEPQSILECFNSLKQHTDDVERQLSKAENQVEELNKELENANAAVSRANQARSDLRGWHKWGLSMYRKISDSKSNSIPSTRDMQTSLSDVIVQAALQKPMKQRLEMLSLQKHVLLASKCGRLFMTPCQEPVTSFRPLIIFAAFNVRVLNSLQKEHPEQTKEIDQNNISEIEKRKVKSIIPISQE